MREREKNRNFYLRCSTGQYKAAWRWIKYVINMVMCFPAGTGAEEDPDSYLVQATLVTPEETGTRKG